MKNGDKLHENLFILLSELKNLVYIKSYGYNI